MHDDYCYSCFVFFDYVFEFTRDYSCFLLRFSRLALQSGMQVKKKTTQELQGNKDANGPAYEGGLTQWLNYILVREQTNPCKQGTASIRNLHQHRQHQLARSRAVTVIAAPEITTVLRTIEQVDNSSSHNEIIIEYVSLL